MYEKTAITENEVKLKRKKKENNIKANSTMMCVFYKENKEKYFIIFKTYVLVVDMFVFKYTILSYFFAVFWSFNTTYLNSCISFYKVIHLYLKAFTVFMPPDYFPVIRNLLFYVDLLRKIMEIFSNFKLILK